MDSVNKTLYIPLYGKAYVSKKGLFLSDKKAEEIWAAEGFPIKGKSASKWLAYYMGIRSAVFDDWLKERAGDAEHATVIHIGCGMDSRVIRAGVSKLKWYDIDFPQVISERRRYYAESANYKMIACDVRDGKWLDAIPERDEAIVIMEGVSMYLSPDELKAVVSGLCSHFGKVSLLMDCYTEFAAKMSKYKNPVNEVGVTLLYGTDDPRAIQLGGLVYVKEHDMTPKKYTNELHGAEKLIFSKIYAGSFSKKLYRLYEYQKS
jgi:O-methyltransferase involved in polyketide biosynthesis